jgi:hypothetical protein
MPDGQQRPDGSYGSFPVAVPAPMLQRLACSWSQTLARALGDNGGRVLPIVLRILLGSRSDTNLSRTACSQTVLTQRESLVSSAAAGPAIASSPEPSRRRTQKAIRRGLHSLHSATRNRTQNAIPPARTAPSLPLWRTFPVSKRCLGKLLNLDHWIENL